MSTKITFEELAAELEKYAPKASGDRPPGYYTYCDIATCLFKSGQCTKFSAALARAKTSVREIYAQRGSIEQIDVLQAGPTGRVMTVKAFKILDTPKKGKK